MASTRSKLNQSEIPLEDLIMKICKQQAEIIKKTFEERLDKLENSLEMYLNNGKENMKRIELLEEKLNRQEQLIKNKNIIIYGIEEGKEDISKLEEKVINLLKNKLEVNVLSDDIEGCFRIGQQRPNKFRGVVVRFISTKLKGLIYNNKRKLKKTGFVIKEDLTKQNLDRLNKAVSEHGLSNVWTINGNVFIKKNNSIIKI